MTQQEMLTKRMRRAWTTPLDALKDCGCMRLAARVLEMRQDGLTVIDKWVEVNGKRFKAYRLLKS
jgi:Helix-turn-helix domain